MDEQDDQRAQEGYLLLADISGYTAFLTGTELEHSHAIIRELTKLIRERLAPPMRFVIRTGAAGGRDYRVLPPRGRRHIGPLALATPGP